MSVISDHSYGIIPLHIEQTQVEVFLIQHLRGGWWGFPKGHVEESESKQQAAERELLEETGLSVQKYLFPEPLKETYYFYFQNRRVHKEVEYFVAVVQGDIALQKEEVQNGQWCSFSQAQEILSFAQARQMLQKVEQMLKSGNVMQENRAL